MARRTEFCVHAGSAAWRPMTTKCFKSKRAALRFMREEKRAEPGMPIRLGFIWPFTKKPAKRQLRVGEKRIYMIRTPSGKLLPVGPSAIQGARRRRRKRR